MDDATLARCVLGAGEDVRQLPEEEGMGEDGDETEEGWMGDMGDEVQVQEDVGLMGAWAEADPMDVDGGYGGGTSNMCARSGGPGFGGQGQGGEPVRTVHAARAEAAETAAAAAARKAGAVRKREAAASEAAAERKRKAVVQAEEVGMKLLTH